MENVDASLWRDTVKYSGLDQEEFLFAASVDTSYPVQDSFYAENALYEKYGGSARRIAVFGCLAAVLSLGCILWLTAVAGRSDKDDELHLNAFDRWKTEIAAAIVIGIWFAPTLIGIYTVKWDMFLNAGDTWLDWQMPYVNDSVFFIILVCLMSVFTCAMFLIGFLSLVRRIKARTVWKNSLLRCIGVLFKDIFLNLNCIWKTVLLFGVY